MLVQTETQEVLGFERPQYTLKDGVILFFALGIVPLMIIQTVTSSKTLSIVGSLVSPEAAKFMFDTVEAISNLY